jgi:hypothetical protein
MKENFAVLTTRDFQAYTENIGFDSVRFGLPVRLPRRPERVFAASSQRLRADGRLRASFRFLRKDHVRPASSAKQDVENVPDAVLYPTQGAIESCCLLRRP